MIRRILAGERAVMPKGIRIVINGLGKFHSTPIIIDIQKMIPWRRSEISPKIKPLEFFYKLIFELNKWAGDVSFYKPGSKARRQETETNVVHIR